MVLYIGNVLSDSVAFQREIDDIAMARQAEGLVVSWVTRHVCLRGEEADTTCREVWWNRLGGQR